MSRRRDLLQYLERIASDDVPSVDPVLPHAEKLYAAAATYGDARSVFEEREARYALLSAACALSAAIRQKRLATRMENRQRAAELRRDEQ